MFVGAKAKYLPLFCVWFVFTRFSWSCLITTLRLKGGLPGRIVACRIKALSNFLIMLVIFLFLFLLDSKRKLFVAICTFFFF